MYNNLKFNDYFVQLESQSHCLSYCYVIPDDCHARVSEDLFEAVLYVDDQKIIRIDECPSNQELRFRYPESA